MIQFDLRIFFKWVVQPPVSYRLPGGGEGRGGNCDPGFVKGTGWGNRAGNHRIKLMGKMIGIPLLGCPRKLGSKVSKWVITPMNPPFRSRL